MKIGATDDFETQYMAKFRQIAAPYGLFMEYATDRAGRDIGLHLTQATASSSGKIVTPVSIWFQMKGIMPKTLDQAAFHAADDISVSLNTSHLAFWYMNPQPTYLVIYVGSVDSFFAIDIKEWVRRNYGNEILSHSTQTVTVRVGKRNILDEHFFRRELDRNLVPTLRTLFAQENDQAIASFLRDSSLVKWLSNCQTTGQKARIRVIGYMSKMRTEVYFESRSSQGKWEEIRTHWQFAMGDLEASFPFLTFTPRRTASWQRETDYGWDGEPRLVTRLRIDDPEEGEWWDEDEEADPECLFSLGNGRMSYGEMAGGEIITHEIAIKLNEVGERWAEILNKLEESEIISVTVSPHLLSVAPWHARD